MEPFLPPPRPGRWRVGVYAASLVFPFTAVQVWAVTVLLSTASLRGPANLALLFIVAGAMVAVLDGWRWTWQLSRETG
ncbi:hypothetical protein [Amycolatopsis anabasis]|uniref:hypothetical protein n=1 Tax=Amycolatopsis anabasis TaxID=1840409 RepID=UPI00131C8140|nr:hypothetical protein [Amycolatopsis anabasis]